MVSGEMLLRRTGEEVACFNNGIPAALLIRLQSGRNNSMLARQISDIWGPTMDGSTPFFFIAPVSTALDSGQRKTDHWPFLRVIENGQLFKTAGAAQSSHISMQNLFKQNQIWRLEAVLESAVKNWICFWATLRERQMKNITEIQIIVASASLKIHRLIKKKKKNEWTEWKKGSTNRSLPLCVPAKVQRCLTIGRAWLLIETEFIHNREANGFWIYIICYSPLLSSTIASITVNAGAVVLRRWFEADANEL